MFLRHNYWDSLVLLEEILHVLRKAAAVNRRRETLLVLFGNDVGLQVLKFWLKLVRQRAQSISISGISGLCLFPHLFVAVVLTTDKLAQAVKLVITIALTDST